MLPDTTMAQVTCGTGDAFYWYSLSKMADGFRLLMNSKGYLTETESGALVVTDGTMIDRASWNSLAP